MMFPKFALMIVYGLYAVPLPTPAFTISTTTPNHMQHHLTTSRLPIHHLQKQHKQRLYIPILFSSVETTAESSSNEKKFDDLLVDPNTHRLADAVQFLQKHRDLDLTRDRFQRIFDSIEDRARATEEHHSRMDHELPILSRSRIDMTDMYKTLKEQGHLRLFGSIHPDNMPAAGSHTVRPSLLEEITLLSMKSLTPKPSNTLLYAGIVVATLEAIISAVQGWDLNVLFFLTLTAALADRAILNGATSETVVKMISPETQPKITRHEAGHFLTAYLLGCPVEGYVLSAWAALQDPRFGSKGVSAGTSFFDQDLSNQISKSQIKRSAIDRYSIIVMAGIAAEAINYGQADGGAGDEMALIAFLSNLNGDTGTSAQNKKNPAWNDVTIRNQARWGVLNAILILREYKECYDALVDALERGGSLGECIYAIENAGRKFHKEPLVKPLGYIVEQSGGTEETWVTPTDLTEEDQSSLYAKGKESILSPVDPATSIHDLRSLVSQKLSDLDEKLKELK